MIVEEQGSLGVISGEQMMFSRSFREPRVPKSYARSFLPISAETSAPYSMLTIDSLYLVDLYFLQPNQPCRLVKLFGLF